MDKEYTLEVNELEDFGEIPEPIVHSSFEGEYIPYHH